MDQTYADFWAKVIPPTITLLITAGLSVLVGVYLEKFKNKLIFLKYNISLSPLAASMDDKLWGNIEVKHNGRNIKNLNFVIITLKNDTNNDVSKELFLDVWVNPRAQILAVNGNYDVIGNSILLESNYLARYTRVAKEVSEHEKKAAEDPNLIIDPLLEQEVTYVQNNKKFHLPIFNRNSSATINLLVESFDGTTPQVYVSILQTAVKLIKQQDVEIENRKRLSQLNIFTIFFNLSGLTLLIFWYPDSKIPIIYTLVVGGVAYAASRFLFLIIRFIKRMFW